MASGALSATGPAAGPRDDQRVHIESIGWEHRGQPAVCEWPLSSLYEPDGQFVVGDLVSHTRQRLHGLALIKRRHQSQRNGHRDDKKQSVTLLKGRVLERTTSFLHHDKSR